MRLIGFSLLVLACFFVPATARATGLVVSSFGCRQQLPCEQSDASFPTSQQFFSDASNCVSHYMPAAPGTKIFDETAGIDGSGCLSTNPEAFPVLGVASGTPQCCIKQWSTGVCAIHCDIVAQ
jgi:hypothetical protein